MNSSPVESLTGRGILLRATSPLAEGKMAPEGSARLLVLLLVTLLSLPAPSATLVNKSSK